MTPFGFFSVVQKDKDKDSNTLTIRARARADLESLREHYLPTAGPIIDNEGYDYPYRLRIHRDTLAVAMLKITEDIDYSNFKDTVAQRQSGTRSKLYGEIWSVLYGLETKEKKATKGQSSGKKVSYGGVLVDKDGKVLLREPRDHYDGYVWTFPKGKLEAGETPEACALKEVLEETGYRANILATIPGTFPGGTGDNLFYLMRPTFNTGSYQVRETQALKWVSWSEAETLISKTTNTVGVRRDLAVLSAARQVWEESVG